MTENHGLAKKSAFIGMSKGGVNEFNWGGVNPDKVACIYADNPAVYDEDYVKIAVLAKHDIPLLHVVGTEDFVLRNTMTVEKMYHQLGGAITVIMKEGHAHHPHSLMDPTPIRGLGVDHTPVERIDSALAHPDEGRFLRQAVVFRHELVPHVPRLALSAGVRRHKGDVKAAPQ